MFNSNAEKNKFDLNSFLFKFFFFTFVQINKIANKNKIHSLRVVLQILDNFGQFFIHCPAGTDGLVWHIFSKTDLIRNALLVSELFLRLL